MINVIMMDKSRGKAADQRGKYELSEETRDHIDALMYTYVYITRMFTYNILFNLI
jgi:hypothetical protein